MPTKSDHQSMPVGTKKEHLLAGRPDCPSGLATSLAGRPDSPLCRQGPPPPLACLPDCPCGLPHHLPAEPGSACKPPAGQQLIVLFSFCFAVPWHATRRTRQRMQAASRPAVYYFVFVLFWRASAANRPACARQWVTCRPAGCLLFCSAFVLVHSAAWRGEMAETDKPASCRSGAARLAVENGKLAVGRSSRPVNPLLLFFSGFLWLLFPRQAGGVPVEIRPVGLRKAVYAVLGPRGLFEQEFAGDW